MTIDAAKIPRKNVSFPALFFSLAGQYASEYTETHPVIRKRGRRNRVERGSRDNSAGPNGRGQSNW
jgi:hypothetical protein